VPISTVAWRKTLTEEVYRGIIVVYDPAKIMSYYFYFANDLKLNTLVTPDFWNNYQNWHFYSLEDAKKKIDSLYPTLTGMTTDVTIGTTILHFVNGMLVQVE
jgi:hypothetical protein